MSAWTLYLIGLCDDISTFFAIISLIGIGLYIARLVFVTLANDTCSHCYYKSESNKRYSYPPIKWLIANIIMLFIVTIIPSSKTLTLMVTIPAITQNENFKELPNDIAMYLRKLINEYTKEEKSK